MSTWKRVVPEQSRKGDLIEHGSLECQERIQYRWVNLNPKIDWVCDETTYTKYYKQKKQVSNDYGQTWGDVIPYQYQRGAAYEIHSTDCGYVPGTMYRWVNMDISTDWICDYVPSRIKFQASYSEGQTYEKECDGNEVLEIVDAKPSGYDYTKMTDAVISDCVTGITYNDSSYNGVFSDCYSLTSVTIPNSVTSIGAFAFQNCSRLANITLPSDLDYIGGYAFNLCGGLSSITFPDTLRFIGVASFQHCSSLTNIVIPSGITSWEGASFGHCYSLTSVTIPDTVTKIPYGAFNQCYNLTSVGLKGSGASVELPDSITSIEHGAFNNCSGLTSVTIPSGVTSIEGSTFYGCGSITSVTIPDVITSIGDSAFQYCRGLNRVNSDVNGVCNIPSAVTSIGRSAFQGCWSLRNIVIPDSITQIGDLAFENCHNLSSITVLATTPPSLGSDALDYTNACPIYVPESKVSTYKLAPGWNNYMRRIQAIP